MTISYEVKRLRGASADSQLSVQNGEKRVIRTLDEQYIIIFDQSTVEANIPDPASVGLLSGVPQAGGWSYYDAIQQKYYPNFTCRSVSIERDETNPFIYRAVASYSDESDGSSQDVQNDPEDYTPTINWSLESKGVTCYKDNTGKFIKLPTDNFYDGLSPVKEVPVFVATIEQIENSLSLPVLEERYKKLNSETWLGFAPETAKVDNISYERALVPSYDVNGDIVFNNAYRVKYVIKCMNHTIRNLNDTASTQNDPNGNPQQYSGTEFDDQAKWGYQLVRVDDWFISANDGVKRPVVLNENSVIPSSWYLKEDGVPHSYEANRDLTPPIDQYVVQDTIDFNGFLRVT